MSSFLNQARARSLRPNITLPRPRLTIVPKVAARAPRVPFVVLVVAVLVGGLVGLLLLNTALQRGAYAVTDLRTRADALAVEQQNLQTQVASLQQPQRVAEAAVRLGMVQNDSPAFLSLSTGKVIGKAVPGVAGNTFDVGGPVTTGTRGAQKVDPMAGGENNSRSTGISERQAEKPTSPSEEPGATTGSGATKPGDTRGGSTAERPGEDRNNGSNTDAQQTQ